MNEILEKIWNEYFAQTLSVIENDEERNLIKSSAQLHEQANSLLNEEQLLAVEKYIDSLFDVESLFRKKAFCRGCGFAVSFILDAMNQN